MKVSPKISIVVLNFNGKDVLKSCLFSVLRMNYLNLEVIVIDNNSKDGSLIEAKNFFPEVIFIENSKNIGYAAGNNIGIKKALNNGADYIVLLNNDTIVPKDFLKKIIPILEKDKRIGLASPIILKGNSKSVWFSGGKINWFLMKTKHNYLKDNKEIKRSNFITGCSMIVRKEVFEKIGLFDETFFLYWEDADLSLRSQKAGFYSVVVSNTQIKHFEKSEERKPEKIYWLVLSGLIFFDKHMKGKKRIWMKIYIFLRKIKNYLDVNLTKRNEFALAVKKAYVDFSKLKKDESINNNSKFQ